MGVNKQIKQEAPAQAAPKERKALTTMLQVETLTESEMNQINGGAFIYRPGLVATYTTLPSDYVELHKLLEAK